MAEKHTRLLAEAVSAISNPAIVFIASMAFISYRFADSFQELITWTAVGSLLIVGPGLIYTVGVWHKEKKIDIDITNRSDRIVPLMLASLGALFGGYLVSTRLNNDGLQIMSNVLVAMLVTLTAITFQWKISLHAATFSALTMMVAIFASPWYLLLYVGLVVVSWSRTYLGHHTHAQVIAGTIVGAIITVVMSLLFRS